jgi:hypothetical protein
MKRPCKKESDMADRYEQNRERFESGGPGGPGRHTEQDRPYQNPSGQGGRRNEDREDWPAGYEARNEREYPGYDDRNWRPDRNREEWRGNSGQNENERGFPIDERRYQMEHTGRQGAQDWDWDRHRGRSMSITYPRRNEWSSGHGVGSGLGAAEYSEYSSQPRSGSYYGGQGQFGGGLSQYGEQGLHAGHGPKGYKRSDERIKEDANERLTQDPHLDAGEIEVSVKDGEVTLTGTVEARNDKRRAEDLIDNISGVREIHNQLRAQSSQTASEGASAGNSRQEMHSGKDRATTGHQSAKS